MKRELPFLVADTGAAIRNCDLALAVLDGVERDGHHARAARVLRGIIENVGDDATEKMSVSPQLEHHPMHPLHVLMTGEREGYYDNYEPTLEALAACVDGIRVADRTVPRPVR